MKLEPRIPIVLWFVAASLLAAAGAAADPPPGAGDPQPAAKAPRPASRPAGEDPKPRPDPPPPPREGKLYRILKFTPATAQQIQDNQKRAFAWAKQIRQTISKDLRLVETAHFLVFTTWPAREHAALGTRCEAMYRALCRQFDIPATSGIWAGKCPIFIFWEKQQFDAFTTNIDKVRATQAGGYNVQTGDGFTYVVLSHTGNGTLFHEVLIHESTHAFLGRYLTNRIIPRWVNEGLAEYMAATLVADSQAAHKHQLAAQAAVMRNVDVTEIFSGRQLTPFGYGIAQSLVRYLGETNRKGFIQFIRLMKEGKSETDALKEALNLTHADLARDWHGWARKTFGAPMPRGPRPRR